jgi:hypothetical protein
LRFKDLDQHRHAQICQPQALGDRTLFGEVWGASDYSVDSGALALCLPVISERGMAPIFVSLAQ